MAEKEVNTHPDGFRGIIVDSIKEGTVTEFTPTVIPDNVDPFKYIMAKIIDDVIKK